MNQPNKSGGLSLNKNAASQVGQETPAATTGQEDLTPEQIEEAMGKMGPGAEFIDGVIQITGGDFNRAALIFLGNIAQNLEDIADELRDIKDNSNRRLIKDGLITKEEIQAREDGE